MNARLQKNIESILNESIQTFSPVGGGCISHSYQLQTESGKKFFLKNGLSNGIFLCEANGLKELSKAGSIKVPEVISADSSYILMEFVSQKHPDTSFFERFGRSLAQMHRINSEYFGFYEDNYIGANKQLNTPEEDEKMDWATFYFNNRLLYQFKLAEKNKYISSDLQRNFLQLENRIEKILEGSENTPSLLHGDLWSGNFLCDENGNPTLIDPAVYYGNRETDLAMTKLFGGFPPAFYKAYEQEYPLSEGWEYRENIYRLYHILNHLNLFGRGYLSEAEYLISQYVE